MLNWKTGGPPTKFLIRGKLWQKAEKVANLQMESFMKKLIRIRSSLGTSEDPLRLLRRAFERWEPDGEIPEFETKPISLIETVSLIGQLKNSTAYGDNCIDTFTSKSQPQGVFYKPVQFVINMSISTNNFPMKWKLGKICPLLKSSELDPLIPESFRPICLLPVLSKLTEKAVQIQLLNHLESTGQLHRDHHAYRLKLNTSSHLLQTTNMIYKATDKNQITATLSIDLSAAFDLVRHDYTI